MTDKYYQDNVFKRSFSGIIDFLKKLPESRANAIYIAVGFFVILIGFMEYKVFESTYSTTGNLVLSLSVLSVTAFGGIIAEVYLHRNNKATDDQLMAANWIFGISLIASAIAGFGIWAQSSGATVVDLYYLQFAIPDFTDFVFIMITVVTIADVLLLRWYIREDVDMKHTRNVERVQSKKRTAELETDESLIEFDAELERKVKKTLRIETKRKQVKAELTSMYGGQVPADILKKAMDDLDNIKRADDEADDDKDGIANKNDNTFNKKNMSLRPAYNLDQNPPQLERAGQGKAQHDKGGDNDTRPTHGQ